jgi:hypothetical protein
MALQIDEASAQEISRLRRELAHVNEQLVVEHAMTLDWRQRYQACEKARASLETKLNTARRKLQAKAGQGTRRATDPGDAILDWRESQDTEDVEDAPVSV